VRWVTINNLDHNVIRCPVTGVSKDHLQVDTATRVNVEVHIRALATPRLISQRLGEPDVQPGYCQQRKRRKRLNSPRVSI
jgi:hypothetical protein